MVIGARRALSTTQPARRQRAMAGEARRQRWHSWHLRQPGFC